MKKFLLSGFALWLLAFGLLGSASSSTGPTLVPIKWWHRKPAVPPHVKPYHPPKQKNKHHTTYRT